MPAGQNWWQTSNIGPGSNYGYGGTPGSGSPWRSPLDAKRSGAGPSQNDYPDGYLGSIIDRRQDKLMGNVSSRLTDRNYQRGVHVGEKVDKSEYFWPTSGTVRPEAGIENQMRSTINANNGNTFDAPRQTQAGTPAEKLVNMGKDSVVDPGERDELYRQYGVNPNMKDVIIDPVRAEKMRRMLPGMSA